MSENQESILDPMTDYYGVFSDLTPDEREHWSKAHSLEGEILECINEHWENATYPIEIVEKMGKIGLFNDGLDIPGVQPVSPLAAGLVHMELARIDGSMAVAIGVQVALCMRAISNLGSEEQRNKYLPGLATGELKGAFAMTEPDHGSDAVAMEATARRDGDDWIINGQKRWIGQGAIGDITVVWARKEDDGKIAGFIVHQDWEGYEAENITGKVSLRAVPQALITLNNVRVPETNRLPKANGFKDAAKAIIASRVSVAWTALGHAIAAYEIALKHAKERVQFGKTLVHFQIIQQRLSDMLGDVTAASMHCRRMADLQAKGELKEYQASMAKVQTTRLARRVVAEAREMLGGSGILLENHAIRHFADMEATHTFEGTDTVQSLIIGRSITGVSAYS